MARSARDEQREQTRKKVFDAAVEVFRRDGVEDARIDDICAMAGVARGTFYFHYPTRQDVLRQVLAESQQALVAELATLPGDAPIHDVLSLVTRHIALRWKGDARLFAEVASIALTVPRDGLAQVAAQNPALFALIPHIAAAAKRGELDDKLAPELLASFFLVNVFAASLVWCAAPGLDLDALFADVVRFFLRATRPE